MIRLEKICKSFQDQVVLKDVSFKLQPGMSLAITGPSGCGKTTLANIILGLEKPDGGKVVMQENTLVAAVFQEDRLLEAQSALANVLFVAKSPSERALARKLICALGLDPDDTKRVSSFSGGMRRRVAIARALVVRPDFLMLDEPFKGLDEVMFRQTAKVIRENMRGKSVLLITHNTNEAQELGIDQTLVLKAQS